MSKLVKRPLFRLIFLFLPFSFCLLTSSAAPHFRLALPGYKFQFPRDHGSHGAFATEWWYYTGHLQAPDGRRFGYQLTWFRTALTPATSSRKSKWATRDLYFAHFALSDLQNGRFYFADRIARGALGLAGADEANQKHCPRVWIGPWNLQFAGGSGQQQAFRATANSDAEATKNQAFGLDLSQLALKPPVIHGENGVSQKSAGKGRASHYYSFTRLKTSGTLRLDGQSLAVTGQSWFDHEFGSSQMAAGQSGWDWFSLQLDDGRELMLYQLRLQNGRIEPLSSGTLVEKNGRARHLKLADFPLKTLSNWHSKASGANYPAKWKIRLPRESLNLEIEPALADQELRPRRSFGFAYWEGAVRVSGTQRGRKIGGEGYLEMTGYAKAFGKSF